MEAVLIIRILTKDTTNDVYYAILYRIERKYERSKKFI